MRHSIRFRGFAAGFGAIALVISMVAPLSAVGPSPVTSASDTTGTSSDGLVRAGMEEREVLGLRADKSYVEALIASGQDVGSTQVGVVLTGAELEAIDIEGRAAYANEVSKDLIPFARALPDFAGAYFDQRDDGKLVILLTDGSPSNIEALQALAPTDSRALRVETAKYSYAQLKTAIEGVWDVWASELPGVDLYVAAIDVVGNDVRLEVDPSALEVAATHLDALEGKLRVPLRLVAGEPNVPATQTCISRHECYNPTEAGTFIVQNYGTGLRYCAMGFLITIGSNEQFLTSGHCGTDQYTYWYQLHGPGWGYEAGSWYYYGYDVMKVEIADNQASDWIYGLSHSYHAGGYRYPIYNEWVCASLPKQTGDWVDCGYIADDYLGYDQGSYHLYGAKTTGIYVQGGDSGAPVFAPTGYQATGLGVMSQVNQIFAILADFMPAWGATVY